LARHPRLHATGEAGPAGGSSCFWGSPPGAGAEKSIIYQVEADDPRVSGTIYVSYKRLCNDSDGLAHSSGTLGLYNAGGSRHCAYSECIYRRSGDSEKPWQGLVPACEAKRSGGFSGLVFVSSNHQAANATWALKGWIRPAK
jgi:hypothetical protein